MISRAVRLLAWCGYAALAASCSAGKMASGHHQYEDQGFLPLVKGSDLSQWDYKQGHHHHWTAKNNVISYDGASAEKDRCLWTIKKYKDFILIADVRLTRKPETTLLPVVLPSGLEALNSDGTKKQAPVPYAGDTGIYLRGESKSQINIGYRNIGSGEIYGYRVDTSMSAAVRSAVTPSSKADKPPGEWNRFVITLKGDRVSVTLNDIVVVSNAQLPGIPAEGAIALQDDHASGNTFDFRNLYIKEL